MARLCAGSSVRSGCPLRPRADPEEACVVLQTAGLEPFPLILILDNVRSVYNVGSIFRSSETARLQEVVTCGITPHPPHEKLSKTALSSVEYVASRHFDSTLEAVKTLKAEGVQVYGMETTSKSVSYAQARYPKPSALILGNELTGICTQVRARASEGGRARAGEERTGGREGESERAGEGGREQASERDLARARFANDSCARKHAMEASQAYCKHAHLACRASIARMRRKDAAHSTQPPLESVVRSHRPLPSMDFAAGSSPSFNPPDNPLHGLVGERG